jgi:hypothetical protein
VTKNEIAIMFRRPRLPAIVLSPQGLGSALDRKQLIRILNTIQSSDSFPDAKVIEITGSEFWFDASKRYLAPGFTGRRWTKKQLIDVYNGARRKQYSPRSLQNFKLERIITDIALLLNKPDDP